MNAIHAMCGVSGCGKSTFSEKLSKETGFPVVSTDAVREELSGNAANQDVNKEVFRIVPQRILEALKQYNGVIYDATNYNSKNRKMIELIADKTKSELIWHVFNVPFNVLIKRQELRNRKVPEFVIKKQFDGFSIPTSGTIIKH